MSLNNKPDNKNWWCFDCEKWIKKSTDTISFPVYMNGIEIVKSHKCNQCKNDTGSYQTIHSCTKCGKIVKIIGKGMGYGNNQNTFDRTEEELCIHQTNENPNNPTPSPNNSNSNNFNWKPLLIGIGIVLLVGLVVYYFIINKSKTKKRNK